MQTITNDGCGQPDYAGLTEVIEYVNSDGKFEKQNCGQAAAATFLVHYGELDGEGAVTWLEDHYPPDLLFGYFGTSHSRMLEICRSRLDVIEVSGIDRIKDALREKNLVILMMGVKGGEILGIDLPGGHWVVAYGYDAKNVYLTNWGSMPWDDLEARWQSLTSHLIHMSGIGITIPPA